jgi:inosine-uridine nucleoside N-ribohydrolase
MSHSVMFDTDMNFGLPDAPVDSGLTLLYLLGRDDIDIKGITITSSEGTLSKTRNAVSWILRLNNRTDIPIIDGSSEQGNYSTPASDFLAKAAASLPGELTILTTGSPANIFGAFKQDEHFYSNIKQLICVGGLFHPLQISGWNPETDINLSNDPVAAEHVLNNAKNLILMNMHIGSQILINIEDLFTIRQYNVKLYYMVKEFLLSDVCKKINGKPVTYLWSMLSAVYIGNRELFNEVECFIDVNKTSLENGLLTLSETGNKVVIPDYITDIDAFYSEMHRGLKKCPFREWPKVVEE